MAVGKLPQHSRLLLYHEFRPLYSEETLHITAYA